MKWKVKRVQGREENKGENVKRKTNLKKWVTVEKKAIKDEML